MELYDNPENRFVAGFIGSPRMNFLPARVTGRGSSGDAAIRVQVLGDLSMQVSVRNRERELPEDVIVGIRPEHFRAEPAPGALPMQFCVEAVEQFGNASLLHAQGGEGDGLVAEWRGRGSPARGDTVPLFIEQSRAMLFDTAGSRL